MITLKPPKKPEKEKKYYLECANKECNAGMVVDYHEMRFVPDQRDGDFYQIDCPHCKRYITVEAKDIDKREYQEVRIRGLR